MMLIGPISLLNICDLKNLKTNLNLGLKLLPITDIGDVNMIFYFWKSFSLKKKQIIRCKQDLIEEKSHYLGDSLQKFI